MAERWAEANRGTPSTPWCDTSVRKASYSATFLSYTACQMDSGRSHKWNVLQVFSVIPVVLFCFQSLTEVC